MPISRPAPSFPRGFNRWTNAHAAASSKRLKPPPCSDFSPTVITVTRQCCGRTTVNFPNFQLFPHRNAVVPQNRSGGQPVSQTLHVTSMLPPQPGAHRRRGVRARPLLGQGHVVSRSRARGQMQGRCRCRCRAMLAFYSQSAPASHRCKFNVGVTSRTDSLANSSTRQTTPHLRSFGGVWLGGSEEFVSTSTSTSTFTSTPLTLETMQAELTLLPNGSKRPHGCRPECAADCS